MARRVVGTVVVVLTLQATAAGIVRADGLPVLGFASASNGVGTLDGTRRYIALPRRHETVVKAILPSGRLLAHSLVQGRFDVPLVAYDGSAGGLSANGQTLVLIRPRVAFPQRSTELAILATRTLRVRRLQPLRGDFSFDAISPDGRWVYLIQYTSRGDPTRYRVRALSTRSGALLARTIVDPHNRGEAMRGNPITRLSSPDGRWAYTLYDGNGKPFVHALDTAGLTARCIDLAALTVNTDLRSARLRRIGRRLIVVFNGRTVSEIDTGSLLLLTSAHESGRTGGKAAPRRTIGAVGGGVPIAAGLALLAAAILPIRRRITAGAGVSGS